MKFLWMAFNVDGSADIIDYGDIDATSRNRVFQVAWNALREDATKNHQKAKVVVVPASKDGTPEMFTGVKTIDYGLESRPSSPQGSSR